MYFSKKKVGNVNLHLQAVPLHLEAEHGTRQGVDDRDSKQNLDGIPNGISHTYISIQPEKYSIQPKFSMLRINP